MSDVLSPQDLGVIYAEICSCLGKPWTIKADTESYDYGRGATNNVHFPRHDLIRDDLIVSIRPEFANGRVRLSFSAYAAVSELGQYLPYLTYSDKRAGSREHFPTITVSAGRDPSAIAQEIKRRIEPGADRFLAACQAAKAKSDDGQRRRRELAERLAKLGSVKLNDRGRSDEYFLSLELGEGNSLDFRVSSYESVYIDRGSIKPDLAAALIKAAVKFFRENGAKSTKEAK